MRPERLKIILGEANLERNKWYCLENIESILLSDGRGIYPDPKHMRFLFTEKDEIFIKHGSSAKYGDKITGFPMLAYDSKAVTFQPKALPRKFRAPKAGDILVSFKDTVLSEAYISRAVSSFNGFVIQTASAIKVQNECSFSFYDPEKKTPEVFEDKSEGLYLSFVENSKGMKTKFGIIQEKIKVKQIEEIYFKAGL